MSDYQAIVTQVYGFIQPLLDDPKPLTEATDLISDLSLDSLRIMNLIGEAEDHYDISIPINDLPQLRTIKDFARALQAIIEKG